MRKSTTTLALANIIISKYTPGEEGFLAGCIDEEQMIS